MMPVNGTYPFCPFDTCFRSANIALCMTSKARLVINRKKIGKLIIIIRVIMWMRSYLFIFIMEYGNENGDENLNKNIKRLLSFTFIFFFASYF